jgi:hypothetical protein
MSEVANSVEEKKDDDVAKTDEKSKRAAKSSGGKVVKKAKKVVASADNSIDELLEWVKEGTEVLFESDDLPPLTDQELDRLPFGTVKRYKGEQKKKEGSALSGISEIETLSGNASTKLTLRKRRGWHQCWKRPDQFEDAKEKGYVEIREQKKVDEKPGYESGPVKKIMKGQGEIELIAMEVSQERYDRHVQAISRRSQASYRNNKIGFANSVEEVNRVVDKDSRARVVDDEGDIG